MLIKRGALIVVEGVDRTGKTTQCKLLVARLKSMSIKAEYLNFPDRSTEVGKVIDAYLKSKNNLSDEAIHLLFSANRWEKANNIIKLLEEGVSVIVDRYCYSGVVFSAAKGLDINWCKNPDRGLPKPDKVFFLTLPMEDLLSRSGFGNERYEKVDFQNKVLEMFMLLKEDSWEFIHTNRSKEDVLDDMHEKVLAVINNIGSLPIGEIWTKSCLKFAPKS